jgi:hypothetical protein
MITPFIANIKPGRSRIMNEKPPALDPERVKEFVIAGHGNLERIKEMLAEQPELLRCAWNWGGGDWETPLNGASHVGSRAVALYLLEQGAPIDIFAAAMLGKLALVKAILADQPSAKDAPGAHGIPLLVHAERGGEEAAEVVAYLQSMSS